MKADNKDENVTIIYIEKEEAIENPEKILTLLVNEGYSPNLFKIEKEDLENYFVRVINNAGGNGE